MIDTKDIMKFLNEEDAVKVPFCKLADHHENIKSEIEAFDYDKIKDRKAGAKCESADALYLRKHIYLIEFKTGFATKKSDANIKTHKENLKLRIRLKAYESLALLEKLILPTIGDGDLSGKIQKIYIAVIDSQEVPMQAYADILRVKSGEEPTFCHEIFKNSLLIYGKEVKNGKKLFYDRVDVWYDYEFDSKILKQA